MADINSLILTAIAADECEEQAPEEVVSILKQKQYIRRYINSIPKDERVHVANVLVFNNKKELIKGCKEGSVINMNMVPDYIITQMYNLLKYKIDKLQSE
jgi:hypothetical protein